MNWRRRSHEIEWGFATVWSQGETVSDSVSLSTRPYLIPIYIQEQRCLEKLLILCK